MCGSASFLNSSHLDLGFDLVLVLAPVAELDPVVSLVPLFKGSGVDLDDGAFDQGLGSDLRDHMIVNRRA